MQGLRKEDKNRMSAYMEVSNENILKNVSQHTKDIVIRNTL